MLAIVNAKRGASSEDTGDWKPRDLNATRSRRKPKVVCTTVEVIYCITRGIVRVRGAPYTASCVYYSRVSLSGIERTARLQT